LSFIFYSIAHYIKDLIVLNNIIDSVLQNTSTWSRDKRSCACVAGYFLMLAHCTETYVSRKSTLKIGFSASA
jgi:hypothetical protein